MMVYAILDIISGEWLDVYERYGEAFIALCLFCYENDRDICEFDIIYRKKQCIM
jgi:hypothetical protein